jgi:hypothetical protein
MTLRLLEMMVGAELHGDEGAQEGERAGSQLVSMGIYRYNFCGRRRYRMRKKKNE